MDSGTGPLTMNFCHGSSSSKIKKTCCIWEDAMHLRRIQQVFLLFILYFSYTGSSSV